MRTPLVLAATAASAVALVGCGAATPTSTRPLTAVAVSSTSAPAAPARVTVTGTGTVNGAPDQADVTIGVETTAAHATTALAQANSSAAAVQAALGRDGVATADLQTGDISLYLNYNGSQPSGYQASDTITATLRILSRAGQTIDDAVAAAGDSGRLEGVSFSIGDTSPLLASARERAVAAARDEAGQLAAAAGDSLGALVSIADQPQQTSDFAYSAGLAQAGAARAPVPLQPGTQQLSDQVTTVWDLVAGP